MNDVVNGFADKIILLKCETNMEFVRNIERRLSNVRNVDIDDRNNARNIDEDASSNLRNIDGDGISNLRNIVRLSTVEVWKSDSSRS